VELYEVSVRPFLCLFMTSTSSNCNLPSSHWLHLFLLFYSSFSYFSSCSLSFYSLSCIFYLWIVALNFIFHFYFLYRLIGVLEGGLSWFATWGHWWIGVIHLRKQWALTDVPTKLERMSIYCRLWVFSGHEQPAAHKLFTGENNIKLKIINQIIQKNCK